MSEYYTFTRSENVNRTSVSYLNRYGIRIAADLYTAKDMDETAKHPALVIGPPYGGVKEDVYKRQLQWSVPVILICESGLTKKTIRS